MTIRDFTSKVDKINYQDLIDYITFNRTNYYVREIVSSTFWHIEACYDEFKDNKSFTVIFNRDCVSPYYTYNHIEMQEVIDKLDEEYSEIKKVLT